MNGRGHRLTAITFGATIVSAYVAGVVNINYPGNPIMIAAIFMAGIIAGSSAPDWLELPIKSKGNIVARIIPHRTITHWFPIWILLGWWIEQQKFIWQIEVAAFGFVSSALLHILMDLLSKAGVPILLPFARNRKKLSLYSTGKFSEFLAVLTVMSFFVFICLVLLKIRL